MACVKKMGKSHPTINEYSKNKRQPSLEDLYKVVDILNVKISELLIANFKDKN